MTPSTQRCVSKAILFILITAVAMPGLASARKKGESSLEGTWFVVIHYTDEATNNPDSTRWLDRVWNFSLKGSRLLWTEYPIVVIEDTTGRFEPIQGNPRSRVLEGWEPNERQLQEIKAGPRVNTRGAKSKSLRGTDERGWKSTGRNNVSSASVVGYQENWSIKGSPGSREFKFDEIFGNAAQGSTEGQTIYTEVEINKRGSLIKGNFTRDDTRRGTFKMIRTKALRALKSQGEEGSVNERAEKRNAKTFMESWRKDELERQRKGER